MKLTLAVTALLLGVFAVDLYGDQVERHYAPSEALIANPERGLYTQLADRRQRPLDPRRLDDLTDDGITLVLRLYYLKDYRERPLDQAQLDLIARDFATLRQAGMKAIIRFAYSSRIGEPDAPLDVVLEHIEQLGPVLRENADLILTTQAGFVGAWGEWHASTNGLTTPTAMRQIAMALLDALPADRTIQVRTPLQKQRLLDSKEPLTTTSYKQGSLAARIGHHNDCFLADTTDVGTYRRNQLESDRLYVETDSLLTPVGGETCRDGARSDQDFAREELARMHWSFLNVAYHRGVIAKWRDSGFLDEVQRKLGYRLRLVRTRLPSRVTAGQRLTGTIIVQNDGWAAPIHDRLIEFQLANARGEVAWRSMLDADLRRVYPGTQSEWLIDAKVPAALKPGSYTARLWLPDPSPRLSTDPRYALLMANTDVEPLADGSNQLGGQVLIEKSDSLKSP